MNKERLVIELESDILLEFMKICRNQKCSLSDKISALLKANLATVAADTQSLRSFIDAAQQQPVDDFSQEPAGRESQVEYFGSDYCMRKDIPDESEQSAIHESARLERDEPAGQNIDESDAGEGEEPEQAYPAAQSERTEEEKARLIESYFYTGEEEKEHVPDKEPLNGEVVHSLPVETYDVTDEPTGVEVYGNSEEMADYVLPQQEPAGNAYPQDEDDPKVLHSFHKVPTIAELAKRSVIK